MKKITTLAILIAFVAVGVFTGPASTNADTKLDTRLKARLSLLEKRLGTDFDAKTKTEVKLAQSDKNKDDKKDEKKHKDFSLPKGIEKRLEDGKGLPPGWTKKFSRHFGTTTPDMTTPRIVDIDLRTGTSTATIEFKTNEKVTAEVRYGTAVPITASSSIVTSTSLSASHTVTLSNLTPATLYHYVIVVKDAQGNVKESAVKEFRTKTVPAVDITAPSIVFKTDVLVTKNSAHIIWVTNEDSNSKVWLSTSTPVSTSTTATMSSASLVFYHDMALTGLTPNTTYFYTVGSTDESGNTGFSSGGTFKTATE